MDRMQAYQELAARCRENDLVAIGIIAWLSAKIETPMLERGVLHARELTQEFGNAPAILALVEERYGPRGGRR